MPDLKGDPITEYTKVFYLSHPLKLAPWYIHSGDCLKPKVIRRQ